MVLLLSSATAFAEEPKTRPIERDGFRVELPAGWTALPEVANEAANSLLGGSTDLTGGAVAYGDRSAGVMTMVFWVKTRNKVPVVRPALEAFHDEIRSSLEGNGTKLARFEVGETGNRMVSALEGSDGDVILAGQTVAAVGKDGKLLGWSAQCVYAASTARKARATCDQVLGAFSITVADKDLKPLEKKK